ncbi:MAG: hypothetical protein M0Z59_02065 [Nitrospiraceae bacterium]|nr:hypothetical protein [Nitrospiraceae bacterium]
MPKINLTKNISLKNLTEEEKGLIKIILLLPSVIATLGFMLAPLISYLLE